MGKHNPNLFRLVIRVNKEDSAFVYFTFEASEGLCFFSTMDESLQTNYRDIEMVGSIDFKEDVLHNIDVLRKGFTITTLSDESIKDGEIKLKGDS